MRLDLRFNMTQKLTLLLVGLAVVLLATVGALSVYNGYLALRAAAVSELLATAIEKQAALDVWIGERQADLAALAVTPHVLDDLADRSGVATAPVALAPAVHDHLVADLQGWTGPNQAFLALTVIEPAHGQVIAATDPGEEGTFREDRAYFSAGKAGPTVQNPQYTVQGLTMYVAAPLRSADGRLLGVLAGRVNLAEMNAIIARRTGLRQTADVYLVNTSNLFVTQPRFIADPVVLQRGIHTEATNRCLARNSGVIAADDYRGVPRISVYRWLPKTELCLIAGMDEAEATAPSRAFAMTILLIAGLALLVTSALAVALARSITRPIHQLVRGAQEIGRGNLDYHIELQANDEIGQLARAFNVMAENLRRAQGELRAWAAELERRVEERAEALRVSEEQYRRIVETAQEGIWTIDAASNTALVNARMAAMLGYTPDEMLGRPLFAFMDAEGQAIAAADVERRRQGIAEQHDFKFKRKDGADLWALLSTNPIFDQTGAYIGSLAMVVDITERRRIEQELRVKDHAIESAHSAIAIADLAGNLTYVNPAFLSIWGYAQRPEVVGRSVVEFWEMGAKAAEVMQVLQAGQAWSGELTARRKDGTLFDVLVGASLIVDHASRPIGMMASFTDITGRKQAEQTLARQAAELTRSNAELEQFAYVASHDLQEPLRMVASYTQLLAQRYEAQLDDRAKKYIYYAVDGAVRMQRLINDLLAFSRVNTQGKPPEPTDAQAILSETLHNLSVTIEESQAVVTHDELPTLRVDPGQLRQVFQNLIANGIKFRREDPPQIHISVRETFEVSETSKVLGAKVWEFSVRDNGIGIDPKYASRLFVIFQRLHTRQEYPGTGIGLAVCKRIVERHGGKIWFESEPGKSTTFYFTLPK